MSGLAWEGDGVPLLRWRTAPEGVVVAFTSRNGGVSEGPFRSLNLGSLTADGREPVAENRRRTVAAAGGDPARATMAWQVHGAAVRDVDEEPGGGVFLRPGEQAFPKSDGLVTGQGGRPLVLLTADCLPVAVARSDGARVAIVHAGWRGLAGDVVGAGVAAVRGAAVAAVGPGAGPCCYEVGGEVAALLRDRFGGDVVRGGRADLWLCAERALRAAGVEQVEVARECTICAPERYFSHRRDRGTTGRQGVVAHRAA